MSDTMTEAPKVDLFADSEIARGFEANDGASLVFGQDFYDDRDETDGRYREEGDQISQAVGTPGYMSNHVVDECRRDLPDGSHTEPPEFDRFYFPPQDLVYEGPAPVLIDMLEGLTDEELAEEGERKEIEFKTAWCRSHGVSYVVLTESTDLFLSPADLRAKIAAAAPAPRLTRAALDHAIITHIRKRPTPARTGSRRSTPPAARARGKVQRPRSR